VSHIHAITLLLALISSFRVPLRKVYDVAVQIAVLASSRVSGHVTGHMIDVAGGMEGKLLS
jgi:hypothetical protein